MSAHMCMYAGCACVFYVQRNDNNIKLYTVKAKGNGTKRNTQKANNTVPVRTIQLYQGGQKSG